MNGIFKREKQPTVSEGKEDIRSRFEALKEEHFMYRHFIDGLVSGKFEPITESDVEKIIEENHFALPPLFPLNDQQDLLLRNMTKNHLLRFLNRNSRWDGTLAILCGDIYATDRGDKTVSAGVKLVMPVSDQQSLEDGDTRLFERSLKKLTLDDKIKFFDPDTYNHLILSRGINGSSGPITGYGNRSIEEYGFSKVEAKELLNNVRKTVGKEKISVLDIGCGMGEALRDLKAIDSNIETHGLTVEQEPAMYPIDKFHYNLAERMPNDFFEKFDLIISRTSFRYHLFPDISLRNTLLALSVGGHADIVFTFERIPNGEPYDSYFKRQVPDATDNYEAMKIIVARLFEKLDGLAKEGRIKYSLIRPKLASSTIGFQGYLKIDKIDHVSIGDLS